MALHGQGRHKSVPTLKESGLLDIRLSSLFGVVRQEKPLFLDKKSAQSHGNNGQCRIDLSSNCFPRN